MISHIKVLYSVQYHFDLIIACFFGAIHTSVIKLYFILVLNFSLSGWVSISFFAFLKGIVSRKFAMLLLVSLES
jgi:hypothetical protein